jgi:hypothetical protein
MGRNWEDFIDGIKDQTGALAKGELKNLVTWARTEQEAFIKKQAVDLERYLTELANAEITKKQFEGYMRDMKRLTRLQALQMSVAGKAAAQRLVEGIQKLIIDGLLALI